MKYGTRKSNRKRKTNQSWDEYQFDDDDYDEVLPPKRSKRIQNAIYIDTLEHCQRVLSQLMRHKFSRPFSTPVDPVVEGIPDYFEIIKNPMDFGTIQKRLNEAEYENAEEFAADTRLVFSNCWTYNPPGSEIHSMATVLSGIFEKQFKKKTKEPKIQQQPQQITQSDDISKMQNMINELRNEHQKLLNELTKLVKTPATPNGVPKVTQKKKRTKKEKVKLEVEMFSVKQKKELSDKINKLSPEDLQGIVELLSSNSEINENEKQNNELEINLELLTLPTLKKLDQYVNDCFKRMKNSENLANTTENPSKPDDSSSDSDSSSSDSSDSESEPEKGGDLTGGKEIEAST